MYLLICHENGEILNAELQQNFRVTQEELERRDAEDETVIVEVSGVPRPVVLKLVCERTLYKSERISKPDQVDFGLTDERIANYRVTVTTHTALTEAPTKSREITSDLLQSVYSAYTLTAELARYFQFDGLSPFDIEHSINSSKDGAERVLWAANLNNRIVYEILVPELFKSLFKIESFSRTESEDFELVKNYNPTSKAPPNFRFRTKERLLAKIDYPEYINTKMKTFHLDAYCFDSGPEIQFFQHVLAREGLHRIYFTGMLVHGQSRFKVNYIDPESHTVRNYHPDFLVITRNGKSIIVEVKNEWLIDDPVIVAKKEAANRLAANSQFEYEVLTAKHFDEFIHRRLPQ